MDKKSLKIKLIIILAVFLGVVFLIGFQIVSHQLDKKPLIEEEALSSSYSLMGRVARVDRPKNYITVIEAETQEEIKIMFNQDARVFKLLYLPEPEESLFTPKRAEVFMEGLKEGDLVFIKADENIAGKKIINQFDYIEIL